MATGGAAFGQVYFTHINSGGLAPPPANDVFQDASMGGPGAQPADVFLSAAFPPPDMTNLGNMRSHDNDGAQTGAGAAALGLQAGDVIDAFHVEFNPLPSNGILRPAFYFSTEPAALGAPGSAVAAATTTNGADVFASILGGLTPTFGSNTLAMNEVEMGLAGTDNIDGLDVQTTGPPAPNTQRIYFSLANGSPSLAGIVDPAGGATGTATGGDILTTIPGSGLITIVYQHETLGMDGDDDLDALTFLGGVDQNNDGDFNDIIVDGDPTNDDIPPVIYFSVTAGSDGFPGNAINQEALAAEAAGDIFMAAPGARFAVASGSTVFPVGPPQMMNVVILASDEQRHGLEEDVNDDLDALDIITFNEPADDDSVSGGTFYRPGVLGGSVFPPAPMPPPGGPPGQTTCLGNVGGKFIQGNACLKTWCFRFSLIDKMTTALVAKFVVRGTIIVPGCDARARRILTNALAAIFAAIPLPGGNAAAVSITNKGSIRVTLPPGTMAGPNLWLVFNGWTNGFVGCVWEHFELGKDDTEDQLHWDEIPLWLKIRVRVKILGDNVPLDDQIYPIAEGGEYRLRLPVDPFNISENLADTVPDDQIPPPDPNWLDVVVPVDPAETADSMRAKLIDAIITQAPGYIGEATPQGVDILFIGAPLKGAVAEGGGDPPMMPHAIQTSNSSTMLMPLEYEAFFDCNNNNVDDAVDIATGFSADANANEIPDECESAAADLNGDGCVDGADLGLLLQQWSPTPGSAVGSPADLNGDGQVDGADLGLLLQAWDPCP